ncbi:SAM-dependent methyltransferase, MidA family [Thiothrix eikelboomii]|uniref:SAM-dependent methyltransferase, MidA family n=1 Tax=Thiothrix eikelboomii TaxID=92487 RepID=A0A1T4X358_9GAMM|nr:SAM-dependent methyltransferase [Thiothrix eikelboomii]SKA84022.1 SAM-dependent methyltransferase, MidA family [Thiothrix eikelboomii]
MRFTDTLPIPSAAALAHSAQLVERLQHKIHQHGGAISFYEFMQTALYEPGLGYYVAGLRKIGAEGDFVTAPEISPLFSHSIANQCAQLLTELPNSSILELGAGSGRMAAQILLRLEQLACLPEYYFILDLSPDLQARQRETLAADVPHLLSKVQWLNRLPTAPFQGVILANEVLDAMPVELFTVTDAGIATVQVVVQPEGFSFTTDDSQQAADIEKLLANDLVLPYTSEFNPALAAWIHSLADCLAAGALLLIDYGYERADYYQPERNQGTLVCHYQHRVHANPLIYPGLQDITASVDFTAVAEAGLAAGLDLAGYTTQAAFLLNCGLEDLFIAALQTNPQASYHLAQQIRTLSLPAEMGERFKVMALTKGFTPPLLGFRLGDRQHRL